MEFLGAVASLCQQNKLNSWNPLEKLARAMAMEMVDDSADFDEKKRDAETGGAADAMVASSILMR